MANFNAAEQSIVCAARLLKDDDVVYIGVGLPMAVALLARYTHAPNCTIITENGIVRTTHFRLDQSTDIQTMADQLPGMFYVNSIGQAGYISVGILGAGQVDRYGNVNTTLVGDFHHPVHRWNGGGGNNDVMSICRRTIILIRQSKRRFLEKVDFITSPGYLDGKPGQREAVGLPPDTGPSEVITNLGVYTFQNGEMVLKSIHTTVTLDRIKAEVSWDLKISPNLTDTDSPTEQELRILRERVDPGKTFVKRAGLIEQDDSD